MYPEMLGVEGLDVVADVEGEETVAGVVGSCSGSVGAEDADDEGSSGGKTKPRLHCRKP